MHDQRPLKLDSEGLRDRMRVSSYRSRPVTQPRRFNDVIVAKQPYVLKATPLITKIQPKSISKRTQITTNPALPRRQSSKVLIRQIVHKQEPIPVKKKKLNIMPVAMVSMAVTIFIFGLFVAVSGWRTNEAVQAQVSQITDKAEQDDSDLPTEGDPPELSSYSVAAELPRLLKISSIEVEARVMRLGVDKNNQLKSPSNIYDTGWYEGSSKPGEAGTVLIDGHVHGPTKPGVFMNLKKLVKGDKIEVERGDGKIITYRVVKTEIYKADQVDMAAALTSAENGKNGLNLITCHGKVDSNNNYSERLVVFTVQE